MKVSRCPCCGGHLPDKLGVSVKDGYIYSSRGVTKVPRRVADLANIMLMSKKGMPLAELAHHVLGDRDNEALLHQYLTHLRRALRPLGAVVVLADGVYRIEMDG